MKGQHEGVKPQIQPVKQPGGFNSNQYFPKSSPSPLLPLLLSPLPIPQVTVTPLTTLPVPSLLPRSPSNPPFPPFPNQPPLYSNPQLFSLPLSSMITTTPSSLYKTSISSIRSSPLLPKLSNNKTTLLNVFLKLRGEKKQEKR